MNCIKRIFTDIPGSTIRRLGMLPAVLMLLCSVNITAQSFDFCYDCSGMIGNCDIPTIANNPELTAICSEMDIILIIDESTSIQGYEEDVENGVLDFVNALVATGVDMAVIEFESTARLVTNYTPVNSTLATNMAGYFNGVPFNGQTYDVDTLQGTNWMSAMQTAVGLAPADLILFFTDGNPTFFTQQNGTTNTCGNGLTTQIPEIVNPMLIANYLKATVGSHMFMMGVGKADSLEFRTNLERMSGPVQWMQGTTEFQSSDYAIGNFETLAEELRAFAIEICGTSVDVDLTPNADSVCVGQTVQFTIQLANTGIENPATNVVIRDTFPAGFTNFQVVSGTGACFGTTCDPDEPSNVLVWSAGDIGIGGSTTLIVQATVTLSGLINNIAWLNSQNTATLSVSSTFYVVPAPQVSIGMDQIICAGTSTTLHAMGSGGYGDYTYVWSTGATTDSIIVMPLNNATYSVTLTDRLGCTDVAEIQVSLEPPLDIDIPDVGTNCMGTEYVLNPGGNTSYMYTWTPADVLSDPNAASPIATITENTTFFVTVTNGVCTVEDQITITVQELPNVQLPDADTSCFGAPMVLNPGGNMSYTYHWEPAQFLNNPNIANPIAEVAQSTLFYVTITDQTAAQCQLIDSIYLFVPPDVALGAPSDTAYCGVQAITLTATGTDIDYTWYESGGNPIGTGATITLTPEIMTTYILEGTDIYGCEVQATVTLTPTFIDYTLVPGELICDGGTTNIGVINNNPGQVLTYLWGPQNAIVGSNTTPTITVNPSQTTVFTVFMTDIEVGCTASADIEVTVGTFNPTNLVVSADHDSIVLGESFILFTNQDLDLMYMWTGPGISTPNAPVVVVTPESAGVYSYAVTVTNAQGCSVSGSISNLIVLDPLCNMEDVFVPDAFSPNGDGNNDVLQVYGNYITSLDFHIYNRWGEEVFQSQDQSQGWDGTYKGKELAPDVFGYYLRVECPPNKKYFTKGNITLFK